MPPAMPNLLAQKRWHLLQPPKHHLTPGHSATAQQSVLNKTTWRILAVRHSTAADSAESSYLAKYRGEDIMGSIREEASEVQQGPSHRTATSTQ